MYVCMYVCMYFVGKVCVEVFTIKTENAEGQVRHLLLGKSSLNDCQGYALAFRGFTGDSGLGLRDYLLLGLLTIFILEHVQAP